MAGFPAFTPPPGRVHQRARALTGHHPRWLHRPFNGGIYSIEHFKICSYCSCIHPGDMIGLLEQGASSFQSTDKPGKFLFLTPNPVAGDLVRMGSVAGPVFDREPLNLRHKLGDSTRTDIPFSPTPGERLSGHFERAAHELAPATIRWPFYAEHTTDHQWPEIWAAASRGEYHAAPLPST